MKIRSVRHNNRKKVFEVGTSTKTLVLPFSKASPTPTTEDPVTELSVDPEAGREAFTYVLHSGRTGTVHVEHSQQRQRVLCLLCDAERPRRGVAAGKPAAVIPDEPITVRENYFTRKREQRVCKMTSVNKQDGFALTVKLVF